MTSTQYNPTKKYFIADPSFWPIIGSVGLFTTVMGLVQILHKGAAGPYIMALGILILMFTMFGWFGTVINESVSGLHSAQMDRTYRWAMLWFIVSELFLFGIFFGALFYTRIFTLPELSASPTWIAKALLLYKGPATHEYLWPNFSYSWPLLDNPNQAIFQGPNKSMGAWWIPALNTFLLLSSAVTVTWAHWGLKKNKHSHLIVGLIATIVLGLIFEGFQVFEYYEAYFHYKMTLASGIYGSTFFILTGLHAWHVIIGLVMLSVILIRSIKRHFLPEHHFAFEAVSWYWHMVDVVWLILFVFVYWL